MSSLSPPPSADIISKLVQDLLFLDKREHSMAELSRMRESIPDLGITLWSSPGAVASLLQEILMVYPSLFPPIMTSSVSTRVCNALALMQCVASHDESRSLFIKGILLESDM